MAGVGFFQRLWKKPIWEGVWPYLGPMLQFKHCGVRWRSDEGFPSFYLCLFDVCQNDRRRRAPFE